MTQPFAPDRAEEKKEIQITIQVKLALAVACFLIGWRILYVPFSSGSWFVFSWCLIAFALFLFHPLCLGKSNSGQGIFLAVAAIFLFLMSYYHLALAGAIAFVAFWLKAWWKQEKHKGSEKIIGMAFGAILLVVAALGFIGQLRAIPRIRAMQTLASGRVASIRLARGAVSRKISDSGTIDRFCQALKYSFPYYPSRESFERHKPWTCTILLRSPRGDSFQFRLARGTKSHTDAAWLRIGSSNQDFENLELHRLLFSEMKLGL